MTTISQAAALALFALLFFNLSNSFGQSFEPGSLPILSKSQMYADFDSLTHTIKEINPQLEVRKQITGIDILAIIEKYRDEIESIETPEEFVRLVRKVLSTCQDGHTSLIRPNYYPSDSMYLSMGISANAISLLPVYDSVLNNSLRQKKFNLKLSYIQGQYFNILPFRYQNKIFDTGYRLIAVNGEDINKYVQGLHGEKRMMRWDFKNRRWYSEDFFNGYHLTSSDSIRLHFLDNKEKLIMASFSMRDTLNFLSSFRSQRDTTRKVEFFDEQKILYIRMPEMEDGDYYFEQIIQHRGRNISKVVIDIRDNPGGSDLAWMKVISVLIPARVSQSTLILCNDSPLVRQKFSGMSRKWINYSASFLNGVKHMVFYSGKSTFRPDRKSLKLTGKIYIIQNENIYSSAGSLAAFGILADNVTVVGSPTGLLLGRGVSPLLFELRHSKIAYRIEPVIDFTNVVKSEDVFHDKVEKHVERSARDCFLRLKEQEPYSKDYLLNSDPLFKAILED